MSAHVDSVMASPEKLIVPSIAPLRSVPVNYEELDMLFGTEALSMLSRCSRWYDHDVGMRYARLERVE